jgi:hypothetical protein
MVEPDMEHQTMDLAEVVAQVLSEVMVHHQRVEMVGMVFSLQ